MEVEAEALLEGLLLCYLAPNPENCLKLNAWRGMDPLIAKPADSWGWLFTDRNLDNHIELATKDTEGVEQTLLVHTAMPSEIAIKPSRPPSVVVGSSGTSGTSASMAIVSPQSAPSSRTGFSGPYFDLKFSYRESTGQSAEAVASLNQDGSVNLGQTRSKHSKRAAFVSTRSRDFKEQAELFSELKSMGREADVVAPLRSVDPRLRNLDILLIGGEPIIHGDVGLTRYVPLPMMGEGFNRILTIIQAIISNPGGMVLIDEIENGLHFSALEKLWSAVAEATERAKVQVFATTHSRECVLAALANVGIPSSERVRVTRLQYAEGKLEAISLEQRHLDLAVEMGLELRA